MQASKRYLTYFKGKKVNEYSHCNCLAKPSQASIVCEDRYINDSEQEKIVIPKKEKAYWTRTKSRGQPSKSAKYAKYKGILDKT
jgi:hypothetical protein